MSALRYLFQNLVRNLGLVAICQLAWIQISARFERFEQAVLGEGLLQAHDCRL